MGVMVTRIGIVVSDKMNKTRVVKVERLVRVPKYEKTIKRFKKYYAHDENNITKVGDKVKIKLTRPISKLKRWEIIEVLK
ncbi:MAG: 30S ribosomal protein S17 [Elusimicrobiota bacterium]|nr:30S ribosomal protein S17 [Endomicrobiia bacterium]MDW8165501.1 30S ribosomal protein S17 [Elusimicrobiota bacterium]